MPRGVAPYHTIVLPTGAEVLKAAKLWLLTSGPWWATSVSLHAAAIYGTLYVMGPRIPPSPVGDAPKFETEIKQEEVEGPKVEHFAVGETPVEPPDLTTETLQLADPPEVMQEEQINSSPDDPFEEAGGGIVAPQRAAMMGAIAGMVTHGPGGRVPEASGTQSMAAAGLDDELGSGGKGTGFKGRGAGVRKAMVGGYGGTKATERAVGAALNWIARHQNPDGSWSLDQYAKVCQDGSCSGIGSVKSNVAATAFALLPFLGAGQTHKTHSGSYNKAIGNGLMALVNSQKTNGDLRGNSAGSSMYVHALATLCLSEAYGLTKDTQIGRSAQLAVHFIEASQDPRGGGWRYKPNEPGDTSVVGWQIMALKSASMANLTVSGQTISLAHKFLKNASSGDSNGLFAYQQKADPTPTMTSVGLLCTQYLGAKRHDARVIEGTDYLMRHLPEGNAPNIYYWYYGTMAIHNIPGTDWDRWNRRMRRILIDSQVRYGCAAGSWTPQGHAHCDAGGRIMVTSLSALTLEVYYRYLPLYRLEGE